MRLIDPIASDFSAIQDLSVLAQEWFSTAPASVLIGRVWSNHKEARSWEDLMGWRTSTLEHFFRPEFVRSYNVRHGGEKGAAMGHFVQMGAYANLGGSIFNALLEAAERGLPWPISPHISRLLDPETLAKNADYLPTTLRELSDTYRSYVTEQRIRARAGAGLVGFVTPEASTEFDQRGQKNELCLGGAVVSLAMRQATADSEVAYALQRDEEVVIGEQKRRFRECERLSPDDFAFIAESAARLSWGIARFSRDGRFGGWLCEPKEYDHTVALQLPDGSLHWERRAPFQRAGILWMCQRPGDAGPILMAAGGDKAPGSATAAPLHPKFVDLLAHGPHGQHNRDEFRDGPGIAPDRFAAAIEVEFVERPKNRIVPWSQRYDYPIFLDNEVPADAALLRKGIGIHRLDHIVSLKVKKVRPL